MKRKIRCICIDGMDKTGKSSVKRQLKIYLNNKNKDFVEFDGESLDFIKKQELTLENNTKLLILKENGLMGLLNEDFKEGKGPSYVEKKHSEIIWKNVKMNHKHGCVNFFLIPENINVVKEFFGEKDIPENYEELISFYKKINIFTFSAGLDIREVFIKESDKILDVLEKIVYILENDYEI